MTPAARRAVAWTALLAPTLAGCATGRPGAAPGERCAWDVCVSYRDSPVGRTYRAENREPVPVTVTLTFRSVYNLRPPPDDPQVTVVAPRSVATVARLDRVDRDRAVGVVGSIALDLGSSETEPDPAFPYRVPFGGAEPRELVQGFVGGDTHLESMRYSLDFAMPRGTPVLAARDGTVLYVQDGFTEGGIDPALLERANLVVVAHRDHTMASYGHLAPGLAVRVGERVRAGDVLGRSGATGFAGRPHLHFHVGTRLLGAPGRTIPFGLVDAHGRPVPLEVGTLVPPGTERRRR